MSTTPPNPLSSTAPAAPNPAPTTPAPQPNTQSVTTPSADGISVGELATAWKKKFPGAYDDVGNHELVSSIIQKYPTYQNSLSTGALQDLLHEQNMDMFLNSPEVKEIKKMTENTAMGSMGAAGFASAGESLLLNQAEKHAALHVVEHEVLDNAGNPLVTKVERGVMQGAREMAGNAYNYVKANPKTAAIASYLAYKAGLNPTKILHLLHLAGE